MDIVMVDAKALQELTQAVRAVLEWQWDGLVRKDGTEDTLTALGDIAALERALKRFDGEDV